MQTTAQFYNKEINTVGHIAASRNCLSFQPDQHVKIILRAMQNSRTGSAGVVDEKGNLMGLLTEREILRRIFAMINDPTIDNSKLGQYVDDMIVDDVMIPTPKTLKDDMDIKTRRISCLPSWTKRPAKDITIFPKITLNINFVKKFYCQVSITSPADSIKMMDMALRAPEKNFSRSCLKNLEKKLI